MMQWYVLQSKPQKESLLYDQLCLRGIETYYPRLKLKPVNPRSRKIKPYFPGYLFIHVDLKMIGFSNLQWVPGESGLITYGGEPASVPESIIHTIRKKVDEINLTGGDIFHAMKRGDPIEIKSGPFAGYSAIFDVRLSGNDRVRVLLQLLQDRHIRVELSRKQIEATKKTRLNINV